MVAIVSSAWAGILEMEAFLLHIKAQPHMYADEIASLYLDGCASKMYI